MTKKSFLKYSGRLERKEHYLRKIAGMSLLWGLIRGAAVQGVLLGVVEEPGPDNSVNAESK